MRITMKELVDRAGTNRMTFCSHYDEVGDVLVEFIDGLSARIVDAESMSDAVLDIESILLRSTDAMQEGLEFYRLVALDARFELYRERFREAFAAIFIEQLKESSRLEGVELKVTADMLASGLTFAYFDWLAGKYGDLSMDELLAFCDPFLVERR